MGRLVIVVLLVAAVAVFVAPLATAAPPSAHMDRYAQRAYRGWDLYNIATNKFNGALLVNDRDSWIRPVATPVAALASAAISSPGVDPSLTVFNLTARDESIQGLAAVDAWHCWIFIDSDGEGSDYAYVNLRNGSIVQRFSQRAFGPSTWEQQMAVDSNGTLHVLIDRTVWLFDRSGRQLAHFNLSGARGQDSAYNCALDIDAAGDLWLLDQLRSYPPLDDSLHLSRYSGNGKALGVWKLNLTSETSISEYPSALTVDSHGVAIIGWQSVPHLVTYDTRASSRRLDIPLPFISHGDKPVFGLLNDTMLVVGDATFDYAPSLHLLDLTTGQQLLSIHPPQPTLYRPVSLDVVDGRLVVLSMSRSGNFSGILAIDRNDGSQLPFEYELPSSDLSFVNTAYAGITLDALGTAYVSVEILQRYGHTDLLVRQYSAEGNYSRSINTTTSGPLSLDESQRLLWMACGYNGGEASVVAFSTHFGNEVHRIDLPSVLGFVPNIVDVQHVYNASGVGLLVLINDDLSSAPTNRSLWVVTEDGDVVSSFPTIGLHPRGLHVDVNRSLAYVAGYAVDRGGEDVSGSAVHLYNLSSGVLLQRLLPPVGWEQAAFQDVAVGDDGSVYALDSYYASVLVFPSAALPSFSSSSSSSSSSSPAVSTFVSSPLPSSSAAGMSDAKSARSSTTEIIAAVVGVMLLALLVAACCYLRRRKARTSGPERLGYTQQLDPPLLHPPA